MSKFKRFGGGPVLSFRGGGGPNYLSTALVSTLLFTKNMKAEMTIFIAQPLFS